MQAFLWLFLALGLAPLIVGASRLRPAPPHAHRLPPLGSVISCTVAFNLTFFWQELWLVIPKALTPGLSPILYHNDHDWTGSSPIAELLQGTGAIATLTGGLFALLALYAVRMLRPGLRVFTFWLAFQGVFQALSQLAVGTLIARNDIGRALAFLGAGTMAKAGMLAASVAGMFGAGVLLARRLPAPVSLSSFVGTRAFATSLVWTALLSTAFTIVFRVPRSALEVVAVPLLVNTIGIGWLTFGASLSPYRRDSDNAERIEAGGPILAFIALLLVFQLVLRPGIHL